MSINKDAWSALSMKERADLINMYITNGISELKEMKKHYNSFGDGGDTNGEEKTSFWKRLLESGQSARDARVGAVGAQQVRDLYSEGKTEEAKELAKKYAKANTTGIALASGAATSSLLGDLAVTGATTTADTLIDGDVNDFGKNFLYNAAADVVGHGIGKYIFNRLPSNISEEATNKIKALLSRFPNGVESVNDISKELKDRLIKEGVDPSLLTKSNLRKMTYLRSQDILNSDAPGKFATRESSKVSNTYNLYNNTNGEIRQVGYISAYPENGVGRIKMVENITEQTPDRVGGVSELGYNTVIKDIGASRNGDVLMQPDKTLKVLDKYPDKKVVSNEGEWLRNGKYTEGNPVFLMETPTYDVPIKYTDDFSTDGLDNNGNFILDFTKGPLLKFGGTLNKFANGGRILDGTEEEQTLSGEPVNLGELEPAVVKPEPLDGYLNTYYPLVSPFPFTGHSELQLVDFGFKEPITITKYGTDYDYNLVTNNCSDATRCAVEQIFGEKINPVLFTTPGDVQDFVAKKIGEKPFKSDKGITSLGFEVPFATAMDLKNQKIDFLIQDYLHKSNEFKKKQQKENPKWDSSGFDESVKKVIEDYEKLKYKFQHFVDGYEIDENGNYIKANGGKLNMFDIGGDKDTWYKRLYSWIFNDDNTEETVPQENKYLTNDNYLNEVSKFISTFEEFYPNAYEDTHKGKNIWTIGSGLTYLLDDEGNEIKVKKGDTITKEENINQLNKRLQKNIDYVKSKTQYWDNYPAELKFQLLDAMYNIGAPKVWNPETNYIKAIRQYENEKGWENPEYDLKNIFQHADWNLNNKGWLGIRSRMRRNPQSINAEDFSKIYQNNYRDSLRTAYDIKFQNN